MIRYLVSVVISTKCSLTLDRTWKLGLYFVYILYVTIYVGKMDGSFLVASITVRVGCPQLPNIYGCDSRASNNTMQKPLVFFSACYSQSQLSICIITVVDVSNCSHDFPHIYMTSNLAVAGQMG